MVGIEKDTLSSVHLKMRNRSCFPSVKEKGRSGRDWGGGSILPGVMGASVSRNRVLEMWSKETIARDS